MLFRSTELRNGDVVEVITSTVAAPNPAWLGFVRTGRARSKIRHYLKTMAHTESLTLGEKLLAQALRAEGLELPPWPAEDQAVEEVWQALVKWTGAKQRSDLLKDIGLGRQIAVIVAKQLAQLMAEQRTAAEQAVKVDLALRAVAEGEGHDASDEDVERHFDDLARRFGMPADEIRDNFERGGHMLAIRSEIKKTKALEWLLASVEILDEDGNVIDRSSLELPAADEDNETENPAGPGEDAQ